MKKTAMALIFGLVLAVPGISFARGIPLFFQTGDELFEVTGAPHFDDGFSAGYACKHFALFGADVWTWDCKMMAIDLNSFSAAELNPADSAALARQYPLSKRERNAWNHYGILMLLMAFIVAAVVKARS